MLKGGQGIAQTNSLSSQKHEVSSDDTQRAFKSCLHNYQNKPWSALYVACIFFMLISLGV
jgi:hypothetical protein